MRNDELFEQLNRIPIIDVHSHLACGRMSAESLDDVIFYHMLRYPLRSAGMAHGDLWPGKDADGLPREALAQHWFRIAQTGFGRILRTILRDLYDFDEPLTPQSLPRLEQRFEACVAQDNWPQQVLGKANIVRICSSEHGKSQRTGPASDIMRFTVEAMPSSGQHEHKGWQGRIHGLANDLGHEAKTAADVFAAVKAYYDAHTWPDLPVLVAWVSSQADFTPTDEATLDRLVARAGGGEPLTLGETRLLEGVFVRAMCEAVHAYVDIFQICYGVQFLHDGAARAIQRGSDTFAQTFGYLLGEYPDLHFNMLNGYEPDEPIWCGLCQGYSNVSLTSQWWTMFYPTPMHTSWSRRLDMVPLNRLCGFLSDGWSIDYAYGRAWMTRRVLANVLAERINGGLMTADEAIDTARTILFETPRELFLPNDEIGEAS
ncbi:MAG: hypothetical protein KGY99_07870 [Phycisphaerae bacterium]|nr:hypothetical protein [Phycisphaerae bacterium]